MRINVISSLNELNLKEYLINKNVVLAHQFVRIIEMYYFADYSPSMSLQGVTSG